jgi:hypothetical protein
MRNSLVVTAVTTAALLVPDTSQAREGPWCAGYSLGTGTWRQDCRMPTFETCLQEVIAGNRGYCWANPRWRGHARDRGPRRAKRKRY